MGDFRGVGRVIWSRLPSMPCNFGCFPNVEFETLGSPRMMLFNFREDLVFFFFARQNMCRSLVELTKVSGFVKVGLFVFFSFPASL